MAFTRIGNSKDWSTEEAELLALVKQSFLNQRPQPFLFEEAENGTHGASILHVVWPDAPVMWVLTHVSRRQTIVSDAYATVFGLDARARIAGVVFTPPAYAVSRGWMLDERTLSPALKVIVPPKATPQ